MFNGEFFIKLSQRMVYQRYLSKYEERMPRVGECEEKGGKKKVEKVSYSIFKAALMCIGMWWLMLTCIFRMLATRWPI